MEKTPAESSQLATEIRASGPGDRGAAEEDSVDLFEVWCRRLRDGDATALEAVFRALHASLIRFASRHLDSDDGEAASDVVQDAFVRVWEGRERLDPSRSLKAFLFQTVRNLALNRGRDSRNRAALLAEKYEAPVRGPAQPDDAYERASARVRVEGWIDALPDRQREALRLSRFEGLDHKEIAEVMGCSPRTVNNHLVKALRTLRDRAASGEAGEAT